MMNIRQRVGSDLPRYFIASLIALGIDTAVLSIGLRLLHLSLHWAATAGFCAGALVAYALSVRWVFQRRTLAHHPGIEFLTFVAIGVAGLGVTQAVLWLGVIQLHLLPEMVKLAAAALTFAFNYLVRKGLLFASARRTAASITEHTA